VDFLLCFFFQAEDGIRDLIVTGVQTCARPFLAEIPEDVLLVMDEAYIDYLEGAVDLLPLIRADSKANLLLMRTFSKIFGLAGLQIGRASCRERVSGAEVGGGVKKKEEK